MLTRLHVHGHLRKTCLTNYDTLEVPLRTPATPVAHSRFDAVTIGRIVFARGPDNFGCISGRPFGIQCVVYDWLQGSGQHWYYAVNRTS